MRRIVMALGCSIVTSTALACTPQLPESVARDLADIAAQCSDVGGQPNTDGAVECADLNDDGVDDYVLYVGSIQCDGAPSIYGDRAKAVNVYVGDDAGAAHLAFSDAAYHARLDRSEAVTRLWLGVMGPMCGKPPAQDFASESFCDRATEWNATTRKFDYAPVSTVRMIE